MFKTSQDPEGSTSLRGAMTSSILMMSKHGGSATIVMSYETRLQNSSLS